MTSSHTKFGLTGALLVGIVLVVVASVLVDLFLPTRIWGNVPFHSTVEALGALAALAMAAFLLLLRRNNRDLAHYIWIASGLVGMGLLDGFHASMLPGHGFVWLHSTASLAGGFLFALVWLPDRLARSRWADALPWGVALAAAIFGVHSVAFREAWPAMVSQGEFTPAAKGINLVAGLLFLAATARFVTWTWAKETADGVLFASLGLLFGSAGLLFPMSKIWQADWWLWHLLRLSAYGIALAYVFVVFQRAEGALAAAKDALEAKVAELAQTNQALQAEMQERQRAESAVARQAREILELSTPVVQMWEGILALPLIGTLDSQRTQQVMDTLLQRIVQTNAHVVLVDITGVPAIDTETARHLVETISAVRLMGAQAVLTGVRPAIAQTLVHLGTDLSGVITRSSLDAGLRYALDSLRPHVTATVGTVNRMRGEKQP